MIRVIFGEKGTGKTKRIIDMANESLNQAKGTIVFIDDDNQYMFDLKRDIRFVNASSFHVDGPKMFYGFLAGLAAQDFDLEYIYVDGFTRIVRHPLESLQALFAEMEEFSKSNGINIVLSISGSEEPPEFLKAYTC